MGNSSITCSDCGNAFFSAGEKRFYLERNLTLPSRCKPCRDKKNEVRTQLLQEISENWNIEAKNEKPDYFFNTAEAKELFNGVKHFVIGRKGTGKTAIAEYLSKIHDANVFSEKLSFKNFPFNYLYSLENKNYTAPNQYISIWKHLIYSCVCKMMIRNEAIDSSVVQQLKKIYGTDSKESLSRMVETWTATEFGVDIFGSGLSGRREIRDPKEMSWIDKSNILEDIITKYLDNSKYFIIIDELDEDYREFESSSESKTYIQLLTSLFKATQDVRTITKNHELSVLPIVFLRTDIFSLIKDSDKNKWNSFKVSLDWSIQSIEKMLAHRIAVASGKQELDFSEAWNLVFTKDYVTMGNQARNQMSIFDYITRSTQLRPRDYIQYLVECSKSAVSSNEPRVTPKIVKSVDDGFSDYLRDEMIDEVHAVIPEISEVLEILSQIRKQTFSPKEFIDMYNSYVETQRIDDQGAENVLRMLFEFSIIGNQPSAHNKAIFKYQTVGARFNYKEKIMIHRGLYKALQIF